jgi:hypothetical protein
MADPLGNDDERRDAALLASVYRDLSAFIDEITLELHDAEARVSAETLQRLSLDFELFQSIRNRLETRLNFWDEQASH